MRDINGKFIRLDALVINLNLAATERTSEAIEEIDLLNGFEAITLQGLNGKQERAADN